METTCRNCGRRYDSIHGYDDNFCCEGCRDEFRIRQQNLRDIPDIQKELQGFQENIQEVRESVQEVQDDIQKVQEDLDDLKSETDDRSAPDKAEIKDRIRAGFRPGDDMLTVKAIELAAVYDRRFDPFKLMFSLGMNADGAAAMMRILYERGSLADNVVTACEMFRPGTEKYVNIGETAATRVAVILAGYWRGIDKNRLSQAYDDLGYRADASAVIDELERRGLLAKDANEDGGYLLAADPDA